MKRFKQLGEALLMAFIVAALAAACGGGGSGTTGGITSASAVKFSNGQAATVVIGQLNFVSNSINQGSAANATTLNWGWGSPYVNNGVLYLPDTTNNRVLVYSSIPTTNGASAAYAIGQPNLASTASGVSASAVYGSQQTVIYNGKMAVAEYANNRVSIYNTVPTSAPGTIDVVVGQASKTSNATACSRTGLNDPEAATVAGGKLIVTDSNNNRVLIWNSIPTADNTPADLVLGQANFVSCVVNASGVVAANTMSWPAGVWSDGTHLVVADFSNNRVLIWNTFPTINNQPADLVLGQPNFASATANQASSPSATTLYAPGEGVYSNGMQLFITDCFNSRVLVWNSFPTTNDQPADVVLGQPNFATNASGVGASTMYDPSGIFLYGRDLIVSDTANNRTLIFKGQ